MPPRGVCCTRHKPCLLWIGFCVNQFKTWNKRWSLRQKQWCEAVVVRAKDTDVISSPTWHSEVVTLKHRHLHPGRCRHEKAHCNGDVASTLSVISAMVLMLSAISNSPHCCCASKLCIKEIPHDRLQTIRTRQNLFGTILTGEQRVVLEYSLQRNTLHRPSMAANDSESLLAGSFCST